MNTNIGTLLTDQILVSKVLSGDRHAFGAIVKNTEGLVAQIIFKMIAHSEDRKDIAQDVYLKAYSKLSGFKFQSKLSTWIGQIAYNSCLNHLEKKKLLYPGDVRLNTDSDKVTGAMSIDLRGHESERVLSRKETGAILQSAIDQLNPIHKTLITLYHQEGLNYEEIMTITGLPEGTVKNYLFRARKSLKDGILVRYKKEEL